MYSSDLWWFDDSLKRTPTWGAFWEWQPVSLVAVPLNNFKTFFPLLYLPLLRFIIVTLLSYVFPPRSLSSSLTYKCCQCVQLAKHLLALCRENKTLLSQPFKSSCPVKSTADPVQKVAGKICRFKGCFSKLSSVWLCFECVSVVDGFWPPHSPFLFLFIMSQGWLIWPWAAALARQERELPCLRAPLNWICKSKKKKKNLHAAW